MPENNKIKIYTKTGDTGMTRLVDGRECSKSSLRVESYGAVDELNSHIGLAYSFLLESKHFKISEKLPVIYQIQNQLFNLGSHMACEKAETRKMLPALDEAWISALEQNIDAMQADLPELKNFILPGGSLASAQAHIARTVCRRAERLCVKMIEQGHSEIELKVALKYLNRLSDFLFVFARWINLQLQISDQLWRK